MSKRLEALFQKYQDPGCDQILIDGTIAYCEDLGFEVEDVGMLALAEFLGSTKVGEFPKSLFISRWKGVGITTLPEMTKYVYGLKERILTDESYLHKIYDFAFSFSLEEKQKKLPRELAVSYWRLLLSDRFGGEVLEKWCKFITDSWDSDIHKDQWLMAFPFLKEYNDNPKFEGYDETAAWPLLMDSFVENETGA